MQAGRRSGRRQRARTNRRARQLQPVYDPLSPLQGRGLKQAANALTNLEVKPSLRALSRQIANINRQGKAVQDRTSDYFTGLGQFGQQAQAAQGTQTDRLNQMLADIGGGTQSQIGAAGQHAQDAIRSQADTGLDGGSWDLLARETAALQANAAQNSEAARTLGATQGSNWEGLASAIAQTDSLRGRERLGEIANVFGQAAAEPQARKADLLASRGDLFTRNLGALRDSERDYMLGVEALGLQNRQLDADISNNRANRKQELRLSRIAAQAEAAAAAGSSRADQADFVARYGVEPDRLLSMSPNQRRAWMRKWDGGGGSGKSRWRSPAVQDEFWDSVTQASSAIEAMRGAMVEDPATGKTRRMTSKEIRTALTTGSGDWPAIRGGGYGHAVNTAMDIVMNDGTISRTNVNRLHGRGIRIGRRYKVASRSRKTGRAISNAGRGYRGF